MSHLDEIFAVYRNRGGLAYGGERISQLEHALQSALLAEQSGADAPLIAASLLHDYGHLVHGLGRPSSSAGSTIATRFSAPTGCLCCSPIP